MTNEEKILEMLASIQTDMNGIEAEGYGAKDVWYTKLNNYMREGIAVAVYKLRGLLI